MTDSYLAYFWILSVGVMGAWTIANYHLYKYLSNFRKNFREQEKYLEDMKTILVRYKVSLESYDKMIAAEKEKIKTLMLLNGVGPEEIEKIDKAYGTKV